MPRKSAEQKAQEAQLERQREEAKAKQRRRQEASQPRESDPEKRKRLAEEAEHIDYELMARAFVAGQRSIERGMTSGEQIKVLLGCAVAHNEYLTFENGTPGKVARAYVRAREEMWTTGLPGERIEGLEVLEGERHGE